MVVGSFERYEIGKLCKGLSDYQQNRYPDMPYKIIREATAEEWKSGWEEANQKKMPLSLFEAAKKYYFYEVSID